MIPNTITIRTGSVMKNTRDAFAFTENAMIVAPNTINGERINRRRNILIPVCT